MAEGLGCCLVVECLLNISEVLGAVPSIKQNNNKAKTKKEMVGRF